VFNQKERSIGGAKEKIDHVVVLMLENRSFDCLLGI
jgi:phospholipase C